jgi:hypothetical protein
VGGLARAEVGLVERGWAVISERIDKTGVAQEVAVEGCVAVSVCRNRALSWDWWIG